MESSPNQNSSLEFLREYARSHGIFRTLRASLAQLGLRNLRDDYLFIKGVSDGRLAFRGPYSVQIDLTNQCNNDCLCCWCNSPLRKEKDPSAGRSLDFEAITKLVDELRSMGTREIVLSGGGEPFMHPRLMDVIGYVKKRGIACQLYTNFTLVSRESLHKLVELGLDLMVASVWAADAHTYALLHPGRGQRCFHDIRNNLMYLASIKNKKMPRLRIHNVINAINCQEIARMEEFALQVKADELCFSVMDAVASVTDSLLLSEEQKGIVHKGCAALKKAIPIIGLDEFMRRIDSFGAAEGLYDSDIVEHAPCYTGWLFTRIASTGDIYPCLKAHRIPVGNIYNTPFGDIWNSPAQREFRKKTRATRKSDPYFYNIGNGPDCQPGCLRACDDLTRNLSMHRKLRLFPTVRLISLYVRAQRKLLTIYRISYLVAAVITYSATLKVRYLLRRTIIFPGE